jgi:hypothetical protein
VRNALAREEFYAFNPDLIAGAVRDAKREEGLFAEYLGEELPQHMQAALLAEIGMWMTIHDKLIAPPVREEEYSSLCRQLRSYVSVLIDLLLLEEEMLRSPLVEYYRRQTDALRSQAAALR